jgi:hypothetical protein
MTERLPCSNPACSGTILPSTADKTGGLCMRCVNEQRAAARQREIEMNRVTINRFAEVEDPVEIIKLLHERPPFDPLKVYEAYPQSRTQVYQSLTAAERHQLVQYAIERLEQDDDVGEEVAKCLACFTQTDLEPVHEALLAGNHKWSGVVFRGASLQVIDRLIERMPPGGPANEVYQLLDALAWARCPKVVDTFKRWMKSPPGWRRQLHWAPHKYATVAGWTLARDGSEQQLYLDECWQLTRAAHGPDSPAQVVRGTDQSCSLCQRSLTILFDLDLRAPELSKLPLGGDHLRLPACEVCNCLNVGLFFDAGTDGTWGWSKLNTEDRSGTDLRDEWDKLPQGLLGLGRKRAPWEAVDWLVADGCSQLGGMPSWVQDPQYPDCSGCGAPMLFVGQLASEDYVEHGEGTFYAFLCRDCRLATANYQQT